MRIQLHSCLAVLPLPVAPEKLQVANVQVEIGAPLKSY